MQPLLHLASQSPRRSELLRQIGVIHTTISVDVDETPHRGEQPEEYVVRLAREKALAGQTKLGQQNHPLVLAADTAVVVNGYILGKPRDKDDAIEMMRLLSDNTHWVFSGVALAGDKIASRVNSSKVTFCEVTPEQAQAYWDSAEPADKAGGYRIQGLGSIFITKLEGSFSGVMGLPLFETAQLLMQVGIDPLTQSSK